MSAPTRETLLPRTQGDRISIGIKIALPDFDFADCEGRLDLRSLSPTGTVLATVRTGAGSTSGCTLAFDDSTVGELLVTLTCDGATGPSAVTNTWPLGDVYGDLLVWRTSDSYGPYTLAKFKFELMDTATQPWED